MTQEAVEFCEQPLKLNVIVLREDDWSVSHESERSDPKFRVELCARKLSLSSFRPRHAVKLFLKNRLDEDALLIEPVTLGYPEDRSVCCPLRPNRSLCYNRWTPENRRRLPTQPAAIGRILLGAGHKQALALIPKDHCFSDRIGNAIFATIPRWVDRSLVIAFSSL